MQWHSYTRAHTGPGSGEFLRALVKSCEVNLPEPQQHMLYICYVM